MAPEAKWRSLGETSSGKVACLVHLVWTADTRSCRQESLLHTWDTLYQTAASRRASFGHLQARCGPSAGFQGAESIQARYVASRRTAIRGILILPIRSPAVVPAFLRPLLGLERSASHPASVSLPYASLPVKVRPAVDHGYLVACRVQSGRSADASGQDVSPVNWSRPEDRHRSART
jgi:hypothetical protein